MDTPLFSDFQQSAVVSANLSFQPEISTCCDFCTGHTTLMRFSAKCASLSKNTISLRDEHVLPSSHRAHHFLAIFSNAHEFVQISVFNPRSTCFVIFALGAPLYSDFQQSARVCTKQRFLPKINVLPFSHCHCHCHCHCHFHTF